MIVMSYGWYGVRLALFPIRLVLFWLHALIIFLTKPGALLLLSTLAAGALWWWWSTLTPLADPFVRDVLTALRPTLPPELYAAAQPIRVELAAFLSWGTATLALMLFAIVARPLVAAFPSPSRPLLPHPPFVPPRFRVRTVSVRTAVRRLPSSRLEGRLDRLRRRIPPEIRELLEHREPPRGFYGGPAEITPQPKPLWPPLASHSTTPSPASAAEAPTPTTAPPPPTPPRKAPRATRSASKPSTASTKGNPPPRPPSARPRKAATS